MTAASPLEREKAKPGEVVEQGLKSKDAVRWPRCWKVKRPETDGSCSEKANAVDPSTPPDDGWIASCSKNISRLDLDRCQIIAHMILNRMITVTQIRNGERYLSRHLSANDYYSEGDTVIGQWLGRGAEILGLKNEVRQEQYEALRCNLHPGTGAKLTPRAPNVAFHDVVISAPKAFSIAAMVGGDERLLKAFGESVTFTFGKMEQLAAVRLRDGSNVRTEAHRTTGIATCAMFIHDASRLLDPQVHAHLLFANSSFDRQSGRWLALQPRQMMEATKNSIRRDFYRDLADRTEKLGYQIEWRKDGFGIIGISDEIEQRYSRRALQRRNFEERHKRVFGEAPTKQRIEQFIKEGKSAAKSRFRKEFEQHFRGIPTEAEISEFVKDARSSDMKSSDRESVLQLQRSLLNNQEKVALLDVVHRARSNARTDAGDLSQGLKNSPQLEERDLKNKESISALTHQKESTTRDFTEKQSPKSGSRSQKQPSNAALARNNALRNLRRGRDITSALKGYPMAAVVKQIRRQRKQTIN